jgi:hypothetical protein
VRAQYPEAAYWAHFTVLGVVNRVNDNMSYLALYPILLLETRKDVLSTLRSAEARTWRAVCRDRNAFLLSFMRARQRVAAETSRMACPRAARKEGNRCESSPKTSWNGPST